MADIVAEKTEVINGEELTYKQIKKADIFKYCKDNNQMSWLKSVLYNGDIQNSYLTIKRMFCEKFFRDLIPVPKEKTLTLEEMIEAYEKDNGVIAPYQE